MRLMVAGGKFRSTASCWRNSDSESSLKSLRMKHSSFHVLPMFSAEMSSSTERKGTRRMICHTRQQPRMKHGEGIGTNLLEIEGVLVNVRLLEMPAAIHR